MRKKIAILGFGREGQALFKFLKKEEGTKAEISVLDKKFSKNYLANLDHFDIIYRSPGVPFNLPQIQKALKKDIAFSSATEIFFQKSRGLIIGVTGTKGKGTVSTLLYKILKSCGKNVYLAGNIGSPAINLLPKLKKKSITVLELSSFQLQNLKYSPHIAVVLGIFPEHLDIHKNFKEYVEAKSNICRYQKEKDVVFFSNDNKWSRWIAKKSRGRKIPVSLSNSSKLSLKIPGEHNIKNAVMAIKVAEYLKCPKRKILKIVKSFRGLEHRLEFVREIKGIRFYNDSASTNPQTAAAAIKALAGPKILIAGGKDKGLNYIPLAKALKNSNTKLVILFGENKNKIKKELLRIKNNELRIMETDNLKKAVKTAYQFAKSLVHNSKFIIHILFSPASASFDQFRDYKDRGEKFKKLVLLAMSGRRL